jgi:hypothetical protein
MKTNVTLQIGPKLVTMQLIEWGTGSALIRVDDDHEQTTKREGKAARVFAPYYIAGAVGPVRRFTDG